MTARRYNKGKLKWSLVNFKALEPMVRGLMYGEHKYSLFKTMNNDLIKGVDLPIEHAYLYDKIESGADNWKKGLPKDQLLDSMMRHLTALFEGEEIDEESKIEHIGLLMCNAMFYSYLHGKK